MNGPTDTMRFFLNTNSEHRDSDDSTRDFRLIYAYNYLAIMGFLLVCPFLGVKVLASKKRRNNVLARLGFQSYPRFPGTQPIWVHALSVGEVLSSIPLLKQLRLEYPSRRLVLSVSTVTGFEIAKQEAAGQVDSVFYFPFDLLWTVRRAVRHIHPFLFFLVESDIWPNILYEMKRRRVPSILVNGRVSPRSFAGYKRISFLMKSLFSWLSVICVQSRLDAERFRALGAPAAKIKTTGSIKFDKESTPVESGELATLRKMLKLGSTSRVFLAGSTHEGEHQILFQVFDRLKKKFDDLVLVLVPRDPARGAAICRQVGASGPKVILKSELATKGSASPVEVVVVDEMGLLGQLYHIAHVAFVGGSLVPLGGHNPLEPAAAGKPVFFGPHMTDFLAISEMLVEAGGAIQVKDGESLYQSVSSLLTDGSEAARRGGRAFNVFQENRGSVKRTLEFSEAFLKR